MSQLPSLPSGYLKAELVHGVDLVKVIHDEVEQRSSDCNRTIVLSGFIYFYFVNFSFQHLRERDFKKHEER